MFRQQKETIVKNRVCVHSVNLDASSAKETIVTKNAMCVPSLTINRILTKYLSNYGEKSILSCDRKYLQLIENFDMIGYLLLTLILEEGMSDSIFCIDILQCILMICFSEYYWNSIKFSFRLPWYNIDSTT